MALDLLSEFPDWIRSGHDTEDKILYMVVAIGQIKDCRKPRQEPEVCVGLDEALLSQPAACSLRPAR
jgi:hypothetical protein